MAESTFCIRDECSPAPWLPPAALVYTSHVPPKPIVTLSPSTITGTRRPPLLCWSIRLRSAALVLTLTYSYATCRLA
jgi:hypothetical protein